MSIRTPGADRVQSPLSRPEDDLDATLRPQRLRDFIGQDALKEQLGLSIAAAAARGDDPRLLARDGLVGLGYSAMEAEQLLEGADGDSTEALIAHALKVARR